MYSLRLAVSATTGTSEFVGVVGNVRELGEWNLEQSTLLTQDVESGKWGTEITFSEPQKVSYRYFIGTQTPGDDGKEMILVRKWEVGLASQGYVRSVEVRDGSEALEVEDGDFGVVKGKTVVDQGWLCGQTEVRFMISDMGDKPMLSWRKKAGPFPENLVVSFEADEHIMEKVRVLKPYSSTEVEPEMAVKMPKGELEVATFMAEIMHLDSFSARFIVSDSNKNVIGYANVVGDMLQHSMGDIRLAIMDEKAKGIGSLRVSYLVIQTYSKNLSMAESYSVHWKKRPTLNIGHRGAGNSFTAQTTSDLFENTISSFKKAALHSAEYIEFDVQLTKDKVPIIFHDFTICASVEGKKGRASSLHEVEVQTMTYNELKTYYMRHRSRKMSNNSAKQAHFSEDDERPHFTPFPKLEEAFQEVPEGVGFDIELKWPHYYKNKEWEHGVSRYFDANEVIDRILDVVFEYAGSRRIMFSCFISDICAIVRRKQNKYPVFQLTNGDTGYYRPSMDLRSRYNSLAVPFSSSERFLGLVTLCKDAYADEKLVKKVHEAGLLFFLYGDDIAEPQNMEKLVKQGADGIIYDRIHDTLPEGTNLFLQKEDQTPSSSS